jgi:hypothetical protein
MKGKLLVLGIIIAALLSAVLLQQRKRNEGVLDAVKPSRVPAQKWADTFRNYRQ